MRLPGREREVTWSVRLPGQEREVTWSVRLPGQEREVTWSVRLPGPEREVTWSVRLPGRKHGVEYLLHLLFAAISCGALGLGGRGDGAGRGRLQGAHSQRTRLRSREQGIVGITASRSLGTVTYRFINTGEMALSHLTSNKIKAEKQPGASVVDILSNH